MKSPMKFRFIAASLLLCAARYYSRRKTCPRALGWYLGQRMTPNPCRPTKLDPVITIQPDRSVSGPCRESRRKAHDSSYKPQLERRTDPGRDNTTVKVIKVNDYLNDHVWNHEGKITHTHSTLSKDGKVQTFYGAPGTYQAPEQPRRNRLVKLLSTTSNKSRARTREKKTSGTAALPTERYQLLDPFRNPFLYRASIAEMF